MALTTPAAAGRTASDVVMARLTSRDRDIFGLAMLVTSWTVFHRSEYLFAESI